METLIVLWDFGTFMVGAILMACVLGFLKWFYRLGESVGSFIDRNIDGVELTPYQQAVKRLEKEGF